MTVYSIERSFKYLCEKNVGILTVILLYNKLLYNFT